MRKNSRHHISWMKIVYVISWMKIVYVICIHIVQSGTEYPSTGGIPFFFRWSIKLNLYMANFATEHRDFAVLGV